MVISWLLILPRPYECVIPFCLRPRSFKILLTERNLKHFRFWDNETCSHFKIYEIWSKSWGYRIRWSSYVFCIQFYEVHLRLWDFGLIKSDSYNRSGSWDQFSSLHKHVQKHRGKGTITVVITRSMAEKQKLNSTNHPSYAGINSATTIARIEN